ncbi:MAG: ribosome recycling factor [Acidobacteriota bacterium]
MELKQTLTKARSRMEQSVDAFKRELTTVRSGRATISILDGIHVDYYGTSTPLNQVATLQAPEPNLLTAQPWDQSLLAPIEKAIRKSDLELNPVNDGKIIKIPIPPLNEERRQKLIKHIHKLAEDSRNALRNIRRDSNEEVKKLEKDKKISQDDQKRTLEQIQKLTDECIAKIEEALKKKEQELRTV